MKSRVYVAALSLSSTPVKNEVLLSLNKKYIYCHFDHVFCIKRNESMILVCINIAC